MTEHRPVVDELAIALYAKRSTHIKKRARFIDAPEVTQGFYRRLAKTALLRLHGGRRPPPDLT